MMYRATFETTKEVIYMDDLRSMIKHISGMLRCRKNHLRGSRTMHETCVISRYNDSWDCWEYTGSMFMHYHPDWPQANWVSLRASNATCCKWSVEAEA